MMLLVVVGIVLVGGGCRSRPSFAIEGAEPVHLELVRSELRFLGWARILADSHYVDTMWRWIQSGNHRTFAYAYLVKDLGGTLLSEEEWIQWRDSIFQFAPSAMRLLLNRFYHYFAQDPYVQDLYDTVLHRYPEGDSYLEGVVRDVARALGRLRKIMPEAELPTRLYTYVNFLAMPAVFVDSQIVAVALDLHLDPKFSFYQGTPHPLYLIRTFRPDYLKRNLLLAVLQDVFPPPEDAPHLLAWMVYWGKVLFTARVLMPEVPDSVWLAWTDRQYAWAQRYEPDIWGYLLDRKWLFETEYVRYRKFIVRGPTTPGLARESPGNLGWWIGLRIVEEFMEKQRERRPKWGVQDLWLFPDSTGERILQISGYRPVYGWQDRVRRFFSRFLP